MQYTVSNTFKAIFKKEPLMFRSPGRINLIGEHTDYNGGFVMPAAIDKAAYAGIAPRSDHKIHIYSIFFEDSWQTQIGEILPTGEWPDYILGVVDQMVKENYPVKGFDIVIGSDIPMGAGLSSSAALECVTAFALNEIFELNIDKVSLAQIGQKAEHNFVGVKCGIMDQFISVMGREGMLLNLDCRNLSYSYCDFPDSPYSLVLFDTGVKHTLGSSVYNTRRKECHNVVSLIQEFVPGILDLRDVTIDMLNRYANKIPYHEFIRAKYVIEENNRVVQASKIMMEGDMEQLGSLLYNSHYGLSIFYDVSCTELDFLVQCVHGMREVAGARMMGAGFGGCTINLIRKESVEKVINTVTRLYNMKFSKTLNCYPVTIAAGTSRIK